MSRQVLVDDTDVRIRYSGQGWFPDRGSQDSIGVYGTTFNRTSHGTNGNDSFSFSFEGTSIAVFGTTNIVEIDNGKRYDPSWDCIVDGISIGTTNPILFAENNWVLCRKVLEDGPHELTVKVTTAGNTFWVDYVAFAPSSAVSYDEAVLRIDNQDLGIQYFSKWNSTGLMATTTVGSQARFNFTGRSLTWVGFFDVDVLETTLPLNASTSTFSIDGGKNITFQLNGLTRDSSTSTFNQPYFTTSDLVPGLHSLLVTYEGGSGRSRPLTLDYLLVTNTSIPQPPLVGDTPSPIPTPSSPATGATDGDGPQPVHSKLAIGAIVGGVVGGVILITLAFIAVLFWRRHKKRLAARRLTQPISFLDDDNPPAVTPFTVPFVPNTHSGQSNPSSRQNEPPLSPFPKQPLSGSTGPRDTSTHPTWFNPLNAPSLGEVSGLLEEMPATRQAWTTSDGLPPLITTVVHQDSGIRMHSAQENLIVNVPPLYTPT